MVAMVVIQTTGFGAHLTFRVTPLLMTTLACLRLVMKKKLVFLDQISQVGEISFWCRKTIKVMLNQSVALEIPGIIAHQKENIL